MMIRPAFLITLGALNGFVATLMAAAGAHALPADVGAEGLRLFKQAADFHLIHALALLGTGVVPQMTRAPVYSGILFQVGILAFSGSLYWRAVMGPGSLGSLHWITPMGGLFLMAGWLALAIVGWQASRGRA